MKKVSLFLFVLFILFGLTNHARANPGDVISTMPLPGGHSGGLAWDGTHFWGTDIGSNIIFQFDTSGNILKSFGTPGGRPHGLAWDGSSLWVSDYLTRLGDTNPGVIYQMDVTGNVLSSFNTPGGWGLTWAGTSLWQSDYYIDNIWQMDTIGNVINSFSSPSSPCYPCGPSDLTFDGTYFYYVNNWDFSGTIYQLDNTGSIISSFNGPVTDAVGITWDGNSLWLSSSLGLYQIEAPPAVPEPKVVKIDIKPSSDSNSINLSSAGVVPVAILTTVDFDAPAEINPDTLCLAGASIKMVGKSDKLLCHTEDVNGDNLDDLVCQFETAQFIIEEPGDFIAVLEGENFDGTPIRGEDSIRIVPDN